jgi:hypothetical protein
MACVDSYVKIDAVLARVAAVLPRLVAWSMALISTGVAQTMAECWPRAGSLSVICLSNCDIPQNNEACAGARHTSSHHPGDACFSTLGFQAVLIDGYVDIIQPASRTPAASRVQRVLIGMAGRFDVAAAHCQLDCCAGTTACKWMPVATMPLFKTKPGYPIIGNDLLDYLVDKSVFSLLRKRYRDIPAGPRRRRRDKREYVRSRAAIGHNWLTPSGEMAAWPEW